MKMLERTAPFTVLTLAAVLALVVTIWLFVGVGAAISPRVAAIDGWIARAITLAVTLALWALLIGAAWRRRRMSGESGLQSGQLSPPEAARRRFLILHVPFVVGFIFALTAGGALARSGSGFADILAAALPILVLAFWVWEFARMIRRADEMMKAAQYRALAIAGGVVLLAAAVWNICEMTFGWPAVPGVMLLPAWAAVYGVALPLQGVES